jgi:hypothetical protein
MSLRDELLRRFPALVNLPPGSYAVGGAVRDLLVAREPADVDVATADPLAAAEHVGPRVIRLGNQEHLSAWRVVAGEHVYDFAALLDGDLEADLARRDFTINAIAVDLETGALHDPHDGRSDLSSGVVRMVDASNFDDDPLRVLKGVRLAVVLGFEIESGTLAAMRDRAALIVTMAAERVSYELELILGAGRLRAALLLLQAAALDGPLGLTIPDSIHADDVPASAAWALVVRDPQVFGKRWRWSEARVREVTALQRLVEAHDVVALYDAGEPVAAQLPSLLRALGRDDRLDLPDFSLRPLLSGEEIGALTGIAPGPGLGALKRGMLEAQLRGQVRDRNEAEAWVSARSQSR